MYSYRQRQVKKKKPKFWVLLLVCAVSFFVIKLVVRNSQSGRVASQELISKAPTCDECEVREESAMVQGVSTHGVFSIDSFFSYLTNEYSDYSFETCEKTFSWKSVGSRKIEGKALSIERPEGIDHIQQSCISYLAENEFIGSSENTTTSDGGKNVVGLVKDSTYCLITTDTNSFEVICGS